MGISIGPNGPCAVCGGTMYYYLLVDGIGDIYYEAKCPNCDRVFFDEHQDPFHEDDDHDDHTI